MKMRRDLWIVSSHYNEDLDWLHDSPHPVVVVSKNEASLSRGEFDRVHSVPNRGSEFSSWLWFIINYWDAMPERVAFIHGHENAFHQLAGIFDAIELYKDGDFYSLNGPRSVTYYYLFRSASFVTAVGGSSFDLDAAWRELGFSEFWDRPTKFVVKSNSQSVVSRALIKRLPRKFYEKMLEFILGLSFKEAWSFGCFLEMVWPMMFGAEPVDPEVFDWRIDGICMRKNIAGLCCMPDYVWHSGLPYKVCFEAETHEEWSAKCIEILELF